MKRVAGFSLGFAAANLLVPTSAKCKAAAPVAEWIGTRYLDSAIKENIRKLKQNHPHLKIGETHCHTTYSDGNYSVEQLMIRSASLGLDFLVITEHLIPNLYPLAHSIASIAERGRQFRDWDHDGLEPIRVYPAFEVSTEQGHLILAFPDDYLRPERRGDIVRQFSRFDSTIFPMETAARLVKPFGGISIIPHPNISRAYPFGVSTDFIEKHLTGLVDAIEDISTGHGYRASYAEDLGLSSIGSSDDHFNLIIGTTVTAYDSSLHKDLMSAVRARETFALKVDDSLDELISAARLVL
ncbi:MAG: hypothetical protein HY579_00335 [Nitrospinae bacterium]|nr:hypothetical protein [Nitrospinota bacterium]